MKNLKSMGFTTAESDKETIEVQIKGPNSIYTFEVKKSPRLFGKLATAINCKMIRLPFGLRLFY